MHSCWVFARGTERLAMRAAFTDHALLLLITESGTTRSRFFRDIRRLIEYQDELERRLVLDGWSLVERRLQDRHQLDLPSAAMAHDVWP